MNKQYNIEYEEAPSGNVTFYNYKEPLMKFEEGYGFMGALVFDTESKKIQCHFCGEWFNTLGNHLHREHAMTADFYKQSVGLNKSTALVNEEIREKLIARHNGAENLRPNIKHTEETKEKIRATLKENRLEKKNVAGTCPAQLLERLTRLYDKLGRTPLQKEISFLEALKTTYGSLENACIACGIPYRKPGQNISYKTRTKWSYKYCCETVREFYDKNNRFPKTKEIKGIDHALLKYGRVNIFKDAIALDGRFRKSIKRFRYTKQELLNFLSSFEKIHGRKPSYSDCKRGLLPCLSRYSYNFGSWKTALEMANI